MEENKLLKKKQKAMTSGKIQNYASACNALADYYARIGMVEPALEEYRNEANAYAKLNMVMDKAKAHRMMGEMFMLLSEYDKALENVNFYLKVSIDTRNSLEQQRAYATIGRIYLLYGQSVSDQSKSRKYLKSAEQYCKISLGICEDLYSTTSKMQIADMQGRLYLNIGLIRETIGEYNESITYIEKAIQLCKVYDLYELLYRCHITKGSMYFTKLNDNAKALKLFRLAINVADHLDDKIQKICDTLQLKSEVLIQAGDFQSAKKDLIKCYKLNPTDVNDRETVERNLKIIAAICNSQDKLSVISKDDFFGQKKIFEVIADGCYQLKSYLMAIVYYKRMLDCIENGQFSNTERIPVYVSLYQTYKDVHDYKNALKYMWKEYGLQRNNDKEAFNTLIDIAEVYQVLKSDVVTVENIYQRAKERAQNLDRKFEMLCVWKIHQFYKTAGMDSKCKILAAEYYLAGININDPEFDNESAITDTETTSNIGDEICIEDILTDSSDDEDFENTTGRPRKRSSVIIKKNGNGETQLHQACISGSEILVTRLLKQGHPVMMRDHAGWLPIHEACNRGYTVIVKKLIEEGGKAQINDKGGMQCNGITPLHDACINGHLNIVELLLDSGANVNLRTDSGDTPIDSLEQWYKDATLNNDIRAYYTAIHKRLSKLIKTTTPKKVDSSSNSDKISIIDPTPSTSYRITPTPSKNLIDDAYTDSDDDDSRYFCEEKAFVRSTPGSSNNVAQQAKLARLPDSSVPSKRTVGRFTKRAANLTFNEKDDDWLDNDMGPNKKQQKFLNDSIFNRFSSISSKTSKFTNRSQYQKSNVTVTPSINSSNSRTQNKSCHDISGSIVKTIMPIKVEVDKKLFLVAVDTTKLNELKIGWLANQASERYYKMFYVRPNLQLTTSDGAFFDDSDPLVIVLDHSSSGEIVRSIVTNWQKPPLDEVYKDICNQMNFEYDNNLCNLLCTILCHGNCNLSGQQLDWKQIQPVIIALQCGTQLSILNLSGNCIRDEGVKHLSCILPMLDNLQILDLSSNFILSEGLNYLNKVFSTKPNALMNLSELNFNFNPFGDKGFQYLVPFINKLLNLKKLHLSNCDIENFMYHGDSNKLYNLILFDISLNNKLKKNSVKKILNLLNPTILQTLNFAYSITYADFYVDLVNFFKLNGNSSGTPNARKTLNELNLINCKLTDTDVKLIWNTLKINYALIGTLRLSQNALSVATFVLLINGCNDLFIKEIYLNDCNDLIKGFTDSTVSGNINRKCPHLINLSFPSETEDYKEELKFLQTFWKKCWGDKACIDDGNYKELKFYKCNKFCN